MRPEKHISKHYHRDIPYINHLIMEPNKVGTSLQFSYGYVLCFFLGGVPKRMNRQVFLRGSGQVYKLYSGSTVRLRFGGVGSRVCLGICRCGCDPES